MTTTMDLNTSAFAERVKRHIDSGQVINWKGCTLCKAAHSYVMASPKTGVHALNADPKITGAPRLYAHWLGFVENQSR